MHVIFILATTEPHKIPLTIASRCQKFRFSKINDSLIADRLKEIAGFENIEIDNDALFEIARLADGGMRDAINILDQLVAYSNSKITLDDIYKVNGSVSYSDLYELLKAIIDNDKVKIIEFVDNIDKNGKETSKFVEEMIIFLKDVILYKNANYLSSIEMKNDNIKLVSEIYSGRNLYDLIECLNNAQNVIKFSTHGSIVKCEGSHLIDKMYKIRYHSNDASNKVKYSDNLSYGDTVLESNTFTNDGVFEGWAVKSSGGVKYIDKDKITVLPEDTKVERIDGKDVNVIDLYAVWRKKLISVSFDIVYGTEASKTYILMSKRKHFRNKNQVRRVVLMFVS